MTSLCFRNRTQELDFLEVKYYANSVIITHFFIIKKHQNAQCLFVLGKLRFPRASKHYNLPDGQVTGKLLKT